MDIRFLLSLAVLLSVVYNRTYGQDTRVKLCGREFIRMVVASCGSSRLKRSTAEFNQQHGKSLGEVLEWADDGHPSSQSSKNTVQQSQNPEYPELIRDFTPSTEKTGSTHGSKESRGIENPENHQLNRMFSRAQRDVGPAGVCCRLGCTISELVQYC
ncbi:insulin-like 3 (Leydig cell) [Scleropages formosus]|uniref:insulin-like 3 (Leydig cell) n=1 Tax=Scleropages formosus TaxID=113540 RepID=UPI0010FAB16D|nr:relaxin-3-like [Scleropages formosus]